MMELVETFDKLDENLDTKVTMDEFLKYQVRERFYAALLIVIHSNQPHNGKIRYSGNRL